MPSPFYYDLVVFYTYIYSIYIHSERAMWVHSQLYSEAKEKQKKKQYVLHYVPLLAGVSQKSVNG